MISMTFTKYSVICKVALGNETYCTPRHLKSNSSCFKLQNVHPLTVLLLFEFPQNIFQETSLPHQGKWMTETTSMTEKSTRPPWGYRTWLSLHAGYPNTILISFPSSWWINNESAKYNSDVFQPNLHAISCSKISSEETERNGYNYTKN